MNSALVGYEELSRSRRVLSTSAFGFGGFTRLTPNFAHAWGVQEGKSKESLYSYQQMLRFGLCEKKYLYNNFTNAFTANVIFLMSHWIKPEPGLLFSLTRFLNCIFPMTIPVILIWESYPILPHIGWTESKISKLDAGLVIFVSKFFKRQKLRRFFFNFQTRCRGWPSFATLHARKHVTYLTCFLKTKKNAIPGKIWSVMARLLLREEENDE